ncbi:hypothetical protein [Pseudoalteromonas sp. DY56-GL79]|uniref:hypothetical protein n=1 Tax=Pseudoalteromonas sp. DY56-GL79 TaxID=2967131 RepID=UPI00352B00DE
MEINKIREIQIKQDIELNFPVHFISKEDKYVQLSKDLIGLFGEIGEFSNLVKKIQLKIDGKGYSIDEENIESMLIEEWVDSFIYMLRISEILEIDIEKEVIKKIKINRERYGK